MILRGTVWELGDNISVTDIVPSRYDVAGMTKQWDECAKHLLEDICPDFAANVKPGDILLAGKNFGIGHAHYFGAAINGCRAGGIGGVVAESFNGIFLRIAIANGLAVSPQPSARTLADTGDALSVDLRTGEAKNLTAGTSAQLEPTPDVILSILEAGSSRNWALRRIGVTV